MLCSVVYFASCRFALRYVKCGNVTRRFLDYVILCYAILRYVT